MALKSICVQNQTFDISYDIVNPSCKNELIILHGWGSNKELMKQAFDTTLCEFKHIYIDLPGFGKSSNDYVLTVYDYAKIVKAFLQQLHSSSSPYRPFAVMGHSYGGKVATLLNPEYLILLSSAGIIEEKSMQTKIKIILAKSLNRLGFGKMGRMFRSKDVERMSENMYATFKHAIAEDLEKEFKHFSDKAFLFWGKSDTATTLQSAERIHALIKNSSLKVYKGDHYFFLKHAQNIGKEIENGIL